MRIATWNVERLKHRRGIDQIYALCERARADIFVLTETDERLRLPYENCFQTPLLAGLYPEMYGPTENRVSIFTNYRCVRRYETFDKYTALCVELETEQGNLLVYGTIIGVEGNRRASFRKDLAQQIEDFKRLSEGGKSLCISGDFNCSFADNYYFTEYGRSTLLQSFRENNIRLLTANREECIDHIAVSTPFLSGQKTVIEEWNCDKRISDHKGIVVKI